MKEVIFFLLFLLVMVGFELSLDVMTVVVGIERVVTAK